MSVMFATQEKEVDLLLVDSGDLHDGTGLLDGGPIGSVNAQDVCALLVIDMKRDTKFSNDLQQSNEFFKMLPYDVLAIGKCVY